MWVYGPRFRSTSLGWADYNRGRRSLEIGRDEKSAAIAAGIVYDFDPTEDFEEKHVTNRTTLESQYWRH